MPYKIDVLHDHGMVKVMFPGSLSMSLTSRMLVDAKRTADENGIKRLCLHISDALLSDAAIHMYELARSPHEAGISADHRIAILLSNDKDFEFYQTVLMNWGSHNVRVFETLDLAQEWLKDHTKPQSQTC